MPRAIIIYQANAGVENVRDRFTYTLADNNGATDTASLIVEIGKTPVVIKADAQQIVPGPDGVVTLPPGVELSDIRVVGRDLVIDLPNGSQMIIVDGAIFVPQLVLDGVEVPSTNLAALLIGQEPQPAAGELPQSSGGNFDVPVPPLDPGVPLGDLIPPTEYTYTPPEPQEVLDELDRDPEIFIQPDGQPASVAAVDSVDEDGLPTRNGNLPNEPAGSDEGADGNPSNNSDTDETTGGLIIYNSPDGVSSIVITGFGGDELIITGPAQVGQTVTGQYGTLTITSVVDGQIGYSYTLADNTSGDATHDDFSVVLTDEDGDTASATLTINVIDDVPTARNDTDASVGGVATGNVMTDAAPGDVGDSDTNAADTVGADNATLTAVSGAGGSDSTFSGGLLNVNGQFGSLTIDAQGNYTYTVNPNVGGGGVDVFTYTLTDGDGDISTATLTITNPDLQPNLPDPAAVLLDDDALANGIPGGTLDDADSSGTPGVLAGTGGDGDLDYAFAGPNTLPAGFTVNTVNASTVQILQGGTVVLTVTLNTETGAFTVVQNNPIDHAAGLDENNVSFGIGVQVVDADGDVEPATITINVDDDTPEMNRADVSLPTLTVDETNLAVNASADYSVIFAGAYGADGPGTTSYAVSVVNGTDSGLVDVATGLSVLLYNVGGVVTGSTAATLAEVNAGNTVFTVSVGSGTGVVALDQIRAVSHPDVSDPDDPVSPAATSIQLTATITDGDGDSDSLSANIGSSLVFEDDGPSVSPTGIEPNLVVDESDLTINETQNFADAFAEAFGADGPADSNSASFALGINAGATGLVDTLSGDAVVLSLEAGVVVGRAGPGGPVVFTVSVNAAGDVVVDQQRAVVHADPTNPDDVISLATDNLITISATVTDRDGDSATATLNIGNNVQLEDDGPSIGASSTQPNLIVDETNLAANATASFAGIFTADFGEDGPKDVDDNDVADADAISYQLDINAGASGLIDTLTGDAVVLTVEAGTIVGRAGAGGPVVFVISVDGSGNVTLDQQRAVVHDDPNDADESSSPAQLSADNLVTLTATITDGDGDQESATANIGLNFLFEDDGPSIDGDTEQLPSLTVDETNFALNASANFAAAFTSSFGADGPKDVDDNDVPDADAISFALGINAGSSGLVDTLTGAAVVLTVEAGTVVGRAGAGGPVVFVVSVDGSGNVTLDQQRAVVHDDPSDADESTSPAQLSAANLVTLTATIIDGDGDRDTATIDIGQTLNFEDDGPSIDVTATNEGSVLLTTQDAETIGAATDQAASAINFSGVFGVTSNGGADGTQNVTTSYTLAVANSVSGLSSHGVAINLYNVGGVIVGSTAGVAPANLTDASIVFTVEVDGSGLVTVRQMQQIDHSVEASPLPGTDAPFDDQLAALADGRITLTRSATITDGDGDTATDNAVVDLGGNILFADHGPIANDDVDSIVSGGDIATGNVITGADTVSGAGGADSSGADAPATIVGVVGAVTSDTNPAGGFVAQGNFGVLTMQADGSYSYDRNDGAPGNAQDIFTYTLRDFDGDTDTATLTINISDAAPVLLTPAPLQLDDDNAQGVTGNPGGPNDDAVSVPLSGTLSASGGDGDLDFFFNAAQTAPAGFTYNVTTGATTQTLEITQTSTGLVVTTVTLTTETGAYTVVQNNPVSHDTQNGIVGLDNTENNTPNFNIAFVARDVDNDPSNVVNLVLNIDDDTPVLSNVAAGVGVTLDETTAGTPAGFPISLVSASAAITATQAFGADGAAAANSVAYGLSIVGDLPELTALRTAVGDHLITLVQIDANTIQGQYNGTNVAFQIDIGTDGRVTLTQNVPLEHNTDGSSAAAHDDSLDLSGFVNATITITDSDGDSTSAFAPIGNQLVFRDDGPDAQLSGQGAGTVTLDETEQLAMIPRWQSAPNGDDQATINFAAAFVTGGSVDFGADGGAARQSGQLCDRPHRNKRSVGALCARQYGYRNCHRRLSGKARRSS